MLSDSRTYMELAPWLAVFPGLVIMLVVLGFGFWATGCAICSIRASANSSGGQFAQERLRPVRA